VPFFNNNEMILPDKGAIVVVAKCPIPGKSKTRLIPSLGVPGSAKLAKAMLSDVLTTIDKCPSLAKIHKILLYAPDNAEGLKFMQAILKELGLTELSLVDSSLSTTASTTPRNGWMLLPMLSRDLQTSNLGTQLHDALDRARNIEVPDGSVVILGMDAPELPLEDMVRGLQSTNNSAILCPAEDGGYGMLCVPPHADSSKTFRGVQWSHSLTEVSQLKALTDQNVVVKLGRLMYDIDEQDDVVKISQRLSQKRSSDDAATKSELQELVLLRLASNCPTEKHDGVSSSHPECRYTKQALAELGGISM
jgi:glycosyltransferase A (GT-A) superfamily protein (DUF2064 family)